MGQLHEHLEKPSGQSAKALPIRQAIKTVSQRPAANRVAGVIEFNPVKQKVMPQPPTKQPSSRRIVFSRPIEEIKTVSQRLFERDDVKPGIVGERCFEIVLSQSRQGGTGR